MVQRLSKIIISLSLLIPNLSWAWGDLGHQTVALVASQELSYETKYEIEKILSNETLAQAAIWPDKVKKDEIWKYTSPYHYLNTDTGKTYWESPLSPKGDAVRALTMYVEALASKDTTDESKKIALRMVAHLVGDLHQPLHTGEGVNRGGNTISFEFSPDLKLTPIDHVKGTDITYKPNLHSLWDDDAVAYSYNKICNPLQESTMDPVMFTLCLQTKFKSQDHEHAIDPAFWLEQNGDFLKAIMNYRVKNEIAQIDRAYMDSAALLVEYQIYEAGMSLAEILNKTLGEHTVPAEFVAFKQRVKTTFTDQSFDFFVLYPEQK